MKSNHHSTFSLLHSALVLTFTLASALLVSMSSATAETVAYWRFEEGPADAQVLHGGLPDGVFFPGVVDSSGYGNGLSVWAEGWAGYAYRTDVSMATVPLTSEANNFSVQNTGGYPAMFTQTGTFMQFIQPFAFTIEVSFKPETGGWRTLVGRDSMGTYISDPPLAALYLQITPQDAVAIKFCDVIGYWHEALSANGIIQGFDGPTDPTGLTGHWYHLAAVSDGVVLSLYLNSGSGFMLVAQTDMTLSGSPFTALTAGAGDGAEWDAGNWSVGRGLYNGGHTDRAFGFIDEVRISDSALNPDQFLFAFFPPFITTQPQSRLAVVGSDVTFSVTAEGTSPLSYQWQTNSVNVPGATSSSYTALNVQLADSGTLFTVIVTNVAGAVTSDSANLTTVEANWPADTFGYSQAQAPFAFENISATGTRVLANTDDTSFTAPVGFNFSFYGRSYSQVAFTPNGLITLGGQNTGYGNLNLTNTAPGGNFPSIAVLWDDWVTYTNGNPGADAVYYQTLGAPGDRRFVVQWNNIFGLSTSPSGVTFQAILFEANGNILCQYLDVDSGNARANGAQSTVGIRDTDGHWNGKNLQWSFNQAVITNGEAILFGKVATDPAIAAQPQSRTNNGGTTATFSVTATGTGSLGYQWQKNGLTLANGGNVSGATTDTLTLANVTASDAANYTVAVTNASGKVVSAVATLIVLLPPVISTQPQSQTALVSSNVSFFVTATGTDPMSYQWQTNSVNILGATASSYTKLNVQLADSGTVFRVIVTNIAGSVTSSPASLTVRSPQTFVVTTCNDSGAGSLRQAVLDCLPGDYITFAPGLSGMTIVLTSGQITLNNGLNIDGSALPGGITINGNHASRIFQVGIGVTVVLNSLTITNGIDTGGGNAGGGGILNYGTLTLNNCTLAGNAANQAGWGGGGILSYNGTLTLNQCTLTGNSATYYGGGIYNEGDLTVNRCTLTGNVATNTGGGGGAIWNQLGTLTVNQSTLTGNNADHSYGGGAIANDGGTMTVDQSTFTANSATACNYDGGGILNAGLLTLHNSIIAGNSASANPELYLFSGSITALGVNLTNGAPLLAPLGNYGGPTPTMPPLPGSPAINGCTNGTSFTTDQRGAGFPRVSGAYADIGAVESGNAIPALMVTTAADENDGLGANAVSLRDAIAYAPSGSTIVFAPALSGSTILLTNSQLALNKNVTIDGSALPGGMTINGNHASRIFQVGIGVPVVLKSLTVTNGLDVGAGNDGGGGILNYGALTLNSCTVAGNSANSSWGGGGILSYHGTLTLNQCTLTGNAANVDWGGGVVNYAGTLTLNQCTLTKNFANSGGGIYNSGATVNLYNSIVAGNTASSSANIAGSFVPTGVNLTDGAPLLAPLGNYGGPTPTMPPLPGSPAIDGCTSGTSFTTDQRGAGFARVVSAYADIGAVESGNLIPALMVNTAVDENDGLGMNAVSLRDAIAYAPSGSTIIFAPALTGSTILLTNGQLDVLNRVTIHGPGANLLTVSGNNATRVFDVGASNVTISGLTIANGNGAHYGSGIKTHGAGNSLTLANCVVSNNVTTLNGAGIFNDPGVMLIVTNCTIAGNHAGDSGGALFNNNSTVTIIASSLSGNSAQSGGGALFNEGASGTGILAVNASTLNNNWASYGAGLYSHAGEAGNVNVTILNSTLSDNAGAGDIINDGAWGGSASLTINANTLSRQTAIGICNDGRFGGHATLEIGDTILNAGASASGPNIDNQEGAVVSRGYNLSSDDGNGCLTNATDRTGFNPLLGPLQNNGGPTWTHALLPGSPAIDMGKRDAIASLTSNTDQRGCARPADNPALANASGGDGSDIGAYEAQILNVTSASDSGPGTLREALANAADADAITFSVTDTITLTSGQLVVARSVDIVGPGAGSLTVSGNYTSRVFNVTGTHVTLRGLTIANGQTTQNGGGVIAAGSVGSVLTIDDCIVTNNSAGQDGGGIYNNATVLMTITNCTVSGNHATAWGGGIYNHGESGLAAVMRIHASNISGNSASSGAGIINFGWSGSATLTISASAISGNSATSSGGGIFNEGEFGGNVLLSISNCTIDGNSASVWGGGIYNLAQGSGSATLAISSSTLSGNWAAQRGGGIDNNGYSLGHATLTLNSCTLSTNATANWGGGIFNDGYAGNATVTISASTFSGNSAGVDGGSIYNYGQNSGNGTVRIGDTILNAGLGTNICNDAGTIITEGFNLSSDNGAGCLTNVTDQININPLLGPLQNNGGPTWTHALLAGSPAIDMGKRDAVISLASNSDQRGLARPVENPFLVNAANGDGSDIGAFEVQGTGGFDTDADSLPDFWELAWFGQCGYCDTEDPDGDGQNNLMEYTGDLNPTDPTSLFKLRVETVPGQPTQRNLVFGPWADGRIYTAQFTTNLVSTPFAPLSGIGGPTTNGTEITVTDLNATESQKFYRIRISLP